MKAQKRPRYTYEVTLRKIQFAERRQERERAALPLLATHIAAQQKPVAEIIAERVEAAARDDRNWRAWHANAWRQARKLFYALPAESRERLRNHFRASKFVPATSSQWTYTITEEAARLRLTLPVVSWDAGRQYQFQGDSWEPVSTR